MIEHEWVIMRIHDCHGYQAQPSRERGLLDIAIRSAPDRPDRHANKWYEKRWAASSLLFFNVWPSRCSEPNKQSTNVMLFVFRKSPTCFFRTAFVFLCVLNLAISIPSAMENIHLFSHIYLQKLFLPRVYKTRCNHHPWSRKGSETAAVIQDCGKETEKAAMIGGRQVPCVIYT